MQRPTTLIRLVDRQREPDGLDFTRQMRCLCDDMVARTEALAARIACHSSVRGGDIMTPQEVHTLLRKLDQVDFRANCPHGRPIVTSHPWAAVARWFDRSQ